MEDFSERRRKLSNKELHSQYVDTLTYTDIRNKSTLVWTPIEWSRQLLITGHLPHVLLISLSISNGLT
jgi:hypothetical protein